MDSVRNCTLNTTARVKRRHRSWPEALKREIVAASLGPGASASVVGRRFDVNSNRMFTWRKLNGEMSVAARGPRLVPIMVTPDQPVEDPRQVSSDVIEVELPRGYRLCIGGTMKAATLRPVLNALERR